MACRSCGGASFREGFLLSEPTKKTLIFALKAIVSGALLAVLILLLDMERFAAALVRFDPLLLVPLVVIFWITTLIGGIRSRVFFRAVGVDVSYWFLVKLYFIGYFFNNFLPSGIGGDVMRGFVAGKQSGMLKESYSAILAERLFGLLGTLSIGLVSLLFVKGVPLEMGLFMGLLAVGGMSAVFILFSPHLSRILRKLLAPFPWGLSEQLGSFAESLAEYRHKQAALFRGYLWSVLYQLAIIGSVYASAVAVGAKMSFPQMCVIAPLVWSVSLVPISLNALGVREASFSYFFGQLGFEPTIGLLVSLIFFFTSVITGIVGGVIFALENMRSKRSGDA